MEVPIYHIPQGEAFCDLLDKKYCADKLEILELSAGGAFLLSEISLPPLHYLNVCLKLPNGTQCTRFACVLGARNKRLRLRWIHFDKEELEIFVQILNESLKSEWIAGKVKISEPQVDKSEISNQEPNLEENFNDSIKKLFQEIVEKKSLDPELLSKARQMINQTLTQENEKKSDGNQNQDELIELLERKVTRLANSLEEAERKISGLNQPKNRMKAIANPQLTPGLKANDPTREAKKALLKALFEENLTIRSQIEKER